MADFMGELCHERGGRERERRAVGMEAAKEWGRLSWCNVDAFMK
jgi:hypothetical protein